MKKLFRTLAPAFTVFIFSCLVSADDFKSLTISGGTADQPLPRVHADQFMVIRNFTQEGGSDRGFVTVTQLRTGDVAKVLTAAILDTTTNAPDVINSIVIAGPADVSVTCGTTTGNCFVSYKKDNN